MSLPDISFENIRPVDGNRYAGFDEMCSQPASLEAVSAGEGFFRKGRVPMQVSNATVDLQVGQRSDGRPSISLNGVTISRRSWTIRYARH